MSSNDLKINPYLAVSESDETDNGDETEHQLQLALAARDEFLSIAAHELRTPLSTLTIHMQMALRQIEKNDPRIFSKEHLEKIFQISHRQTTRLIGLVDQLLDVSRIMNGRMKLDLEDIQINKLSTEILHRFQDEANDAHTPISLNIDHEMHGNFDRRGLDQVLSNLISNAIRFGNAKPIQVKIYTETDQMIVEVKDSGIGIDQKDFCKIFKKFKKIGESNPSSGLGVGLYITRQIVLAHGGRIYFNSQLNEGSTFTVRMPLTREIKSEFISKECH